MDWWQIALIILGAVVVGLVVGGLVSLLIGRLLHKPVFVRGGASESPVEAPPSPSAAGEKDKAPGGGFLTRIAKKPFSRRQEARTIAEEQPVTAPPERAAPAPAQPEETAPQKVKAVAAQPARVDPDLFSEVDNNRKLAVKPPGEKLVPFQTQAWDASRDGEQELPVQLREDLSQAYVDMRLANSIVWLSAELGRRSPNLDESYAKLCVNIATRLNRVAPQLK